jgi:hypothetical protein
MQQTVITAGAKASADFESKEYLWSVTWLLLINEMGSSEVFVG